MSTVTTRRLKGQLSMYLHRAEAGESVVVLRDGKPIAAIVPISQMPQSSESERLARLAARGAVRLPSRTSDKQLAGPQVPTRGRLGSQMVVEDRR